VKDHHLRDDDGKLDRKVKGSSEVNMTAYSFIIPKRAYDGFLDLIEIGPRLTRPYHEELRVLGVAAQQQAPGVWQLQGGLVVHPTWGLETEELAGLSHPLLTQFSPRFLQESAATYDALQQGGYTELVTYLAQQIHQFRRLGKEFAMQHLGSEELQRVWRDILATMTPEERLDGLPARERLKGLSVEERLEGLSAKELERLRQLLQSQTRADNSAPPDAKTS
jgi:hypothetical protein